MGTDTDEDMRKLHRPPERTDMVCLMKDSNTFSGQELQSHKSCSKIT